MPERLINCGHVFMLRADGLYEAVDKFEMTEDEWYDSDDSYGFTMLFLNENGKQYPWILLTDYSKVPEFYCLADSVDNASGTTGRTQKKGELVLNDIYLSK